MMNVFTGMAMMILAGVLFFKFRPRSQNSRELCALTGLMGFMVLYAGAGSWKFQLIQLALQAVVGFCCFVQLRREKIIRARRAVRKHAHRPVSVQQQIKTCA